MTQDKQEKELRLRVLHEMLYEAIAFPDFSPLYTNFVRSLREKIHPVSVWEPRTTELASGLKFTVDLGDRLGCDLYYGYYSEYFDYQLFFSLINPKDIVIDIGANFGFYAINGAKIVGEQGNVYAFEPNQDAYKLLQENVNINGFSEIIHSYQACIGAEDGETNFYVSEESSFSSLGATGRAKIREQITVPIYKLDSFLSQQGLTTVKAIKIDVEGFEYMVLQGLLDTLQRNPELVIMMEVSSKNLDTQRRTELIAILKQIYQLNFRGWVVDLSPDRLTLLETPEDMASLGSANVFVIQAESETEKQLQSAYQDLCFKAVKGISQEAILSLPLSEDDETLEYKKLYTSLLSNILGKGQGSYNQQKLELDKARAEIVRLSQKAEARVQEIYKRDAQIKELQQENEKIKKTSLLGITDKISSKFKGLRKK